MSVHFAGKGFPMSGQGTTLERALIGGLLGAGVAVACLIPPILHFVTGPLGPLIGGAFAGVRFQTTGAYAPLAGLTIGAVLALVVPLLGTLLQAVLPVRFPTEALLIVGVVTFVYASALGT